jgi:dienelactone hydrolase
MRPSDADDAPAGDARAGKPRKVVVVQIALGALLLMLLIVARPLLGHAKAAGVLLRLGDANTGGALRTFGALPVTRTSLDLDLPRGKVRAYRYAADTAGPAFGMVLIHGVHHRGIDEPRLARFADSIAATGITVLTPEVPSLTDYRIDHDAIVEIGAAAHALREQLGGDKPVGVLGISFAGSLALLAAADPAVGGDIGYVVTVGSYDDLARVCRFFGTGTIERPDGSSVAILPHEYGPVVWIYSHLADFFPAEGLDDVRDALREWLHENRDAAHQKAAKLPEPSRQRLEAVFAGDFAAAAPNLAASVDRYRDDLAALSPHGHLAQLKVAVFALHGSDDRLIPSSETLWLAHDLPPGTLAYALISRAVTHVEIGDHASFLEQLQAVHFMAGILAEARHPG